VVGRDNEALFNESATEEVGIALDTIDTVVADNAASDCIEIVAVSDGLVDADCLERLGAEDRSEPKGLPEENASEIAEVPIDETNST